jgi:uncharacterized membrane protein
MIRDSVNAILHDKKSNQKYRIKIETEIVPKTSFPLSLLCHKYPLEGEGHQIKTKITNLSDKTLPLQEKCLKITHSYTQSPDLSVTYSPITIPELLPEETKEIDVTNITAIIGGGYWIDFRGRGDIEIINESESASPQFKSYISRRSDISQTIIIWLTLVLVILTTLYVWLFLLTISQK